MRATIAGLCILLACTAAQAATPDAVLKANETVSGAWRGKAAVRIDYRYSGQGLTGTASSLIDLTAPRFVDRSDTPPIATAGGFDGVHAWEREPSGTVTEQSGGDVIPLAINESYRARHLWWRADRGGAAIAALGTRDGLDGLAVTPKGGERFEAWFDARTHLLARVVEVQGAQTLTTQFDDYAAADGATLARKLTVIDAGGPQNAQTYTVTAAKFIPEPPATAFAQPRMRPNDCSVAGGETTIPFQLINNHVYANVAVNGSAPMPFLIDSGATDILTPAAAALLKLNPLGSQTALGGGAQVAQSGVAMVDSIAIGGAAMTRQPVSVLQFQPPGVEGIQAGGVLGYAFFVRFVVRIDYAARTITIGDGTRFDRKRAGTPVPFAFYHALTEIDGSFNGAPGRFALDTGSRLSLGLTAPFVARNRLGTGQAVEALIGWGIGGPNRGKLLRGGVLKLGPVAVDGPLTLLLADRGGGDAAAAFPNNVGGGVLKRFVVTFDYARRLIYFKPVAGPIADLDSFDRSGLWINQAEGGFEIMDVTDGGPAQAAGLKKGDTIVAVDGKPFGAIALADLRQRLRNDPVGTVVTFRLTSGKDVKIVLRDQI